MNAVRLGVVPRAHDAQRATTADRAATADRALAADTATTAARVDGRMVTATRVEPTVGADPPAALAAAPEVTLFKVGVLTVYGRCWASGGGIWAAAFVKTSQDGAVLMTETGETFLFGQPSYLNVETPENDRDLFQLSTGGNAAFSSPPDTTAFYAAGPDGTEIKGDVFIGVKIGSPPQGDGPYGPGNSCRFSGAIDRMD